MPIVSSVKGINQAEEPKKNSSVNVVASLHAHSYRNLCVLAFQAPQAPRLWWAFDFLIYVQAGKQLHVRRVALRHAPVSSLSFSL